MKLIPAIQYIDSAISEVEARGMLAFLAIQEGYINGRVLPSIGSTPFRVQAFFEHDGLTDGWLPDGCRRVLCPAHMLA